MKNVQRSKFNVLILARRIIATPFYMMARVMLVLSYAFGWGFKRAKDLWNATA